MVDVKKKRSKGGRDAWMYTERPFCMAARLRAPILEALARLGPSSSTKLLQTMLISILLLLPIVGADLGVYSGKIMYSKL